MGVNFVILIENVNKRTREEIDREFPPQDWMETQWELFKFRGKEYAIWLYPPRFFVIEENPEKWEALRKFLVRVENFFGGEILMTNDTCWFGFPENEEDEETGPYDIPSPLPRSYMEEPDYEKYPELKNIGELEGLVW